MSGTPTLPWQGGTPERDATGAAAELGQPEASRPESTDKLPDRPTGEPSGPGSTLQTGEASPGDRTTGEAMLAATMPGEDPGVA